MRLGGTLRCRRPTYRNTSKSTRAEFAQPESVTLNEILIPTPAKSATEPSDAADVAAAQAQADAIVAKLAAGAKFEDLAKPAPVDPNAPKSVSLGEFHRGQLAKEIEDKAFALNAGQYTQPIRTKQGFIILQVTQHTAGGEGSYKQVEPQVEEALFMERMQPALRQYLTSLRDTAYVEIKPGVTDTGASGNEMRLSYSAYTPPPPKKKKKFVRARFRGKTRSTPAVAPTQTAATKPATAGTPSATGAPATAGATQQASNAGEKVMKPGKPEKIRFGQAPRESLPSAQNGPTGAAAGPADANSQTASVTTPEVRFVNPDGSVSSTSTAAPEKKTRLSNRAPVPKAKKVKGAADTPPPATADELAAQKVQSAPLGLADPADQTKKKPKGDKTRLADKPKPPDQTPAPYLGSPSRSQPPTSLLRLRLTNLRPLPANRLPGPRAQPNLSRRRGEMNAGEMKEIYVADVGKFENQAVVSFFAVASKQVRSRKDGSGQYMALTLGDRTGQIESRMWENFADAAAGFEQGDVVKVRAEVCRYNGRLQLNLEKLRLAAADEVELADYVPHTQKDVEELWSALVRSVDSFSDLSLQSLLRAFLDDPVFAAAFREAPAAKTLHHAWLGGLLEHVVSLVGICELAARHYPEINRDLLLTGAILHDIGKLEELRWGTSFDYTLQGQLVGHITLGIAMIEKKLAALPDFPPALRILVEHMVLSHHGKLEFGSPKLPMIPEAVLLHYLDDLDAKMHMMRSEFARHEAEGGEAGEMTDWVRAMDRPLLNTATFLKASTEEPS